VVVMFDSVEQFHAARARTLHVVEWIFTILFTAKYALRLSVVKRPLRYALSIWGIIDLASILPTYLSVLVPGSQSLLVVRSLRILRVFRMLKLTRYVEESGIVMQSLWRSRRKILLFLFTVLTITIIAAALMHVIEGPEHGFTSIPTSMYWAVVTMATVGFGDIVPETPSGRFITSTLILIGYSIIAVPTGIYTAELANSMREAEISNQDSHTCTGCNAQGHQPDSTHCRHCGTRLKQRH
jgi:voltage-gated potassium channel